MTDSTPPLTFRHIQRAAERLADHAFTTPLLSNPTLDEFTRAHVLLKAENLQRTGSFKFRGAYNRLVQLSADQREHGVVAWSSGNHAQGVAAAGQLLEIPSTIVMPRDAPAIKIEGTRKLGASIVFYDRATESREAIAREIVSDTRAVLVPSYDDYDIMAGQGTCGLELFQQYKQRSTNNASPLERVLIPCGGGGLAAGVGTAIKHLTPSTEIELVEPAPCNDHQRSMASGERETNPSAAFTICDALLAPTPGALTFPINRQQVTRARTVTDAEVSDAMKFAFDELKLVLEPGGAVGLAAILAHPDQFRGQSVAVILSGGNVDPGTFAAATV